MSLSQVQLFEDEIPLIRSCPALNEIRITGEIKDLSIEVKDGARLDAHRIILAARIPSLRASLNCGSGKGIPILRWPTVPLDLATFLLQYVYTGQLEMTESNARGMITLARTVQVPVLEHWGTKFLVSTINTENLASIWNFSRTLNSTLLADACLRKMKAQFESFVYSNLFFRLPADIVLTLLQSDDLAVNSEEQVFGAISRWAGRGKKVNDTKLKSHVPAMLKEIQWHQTTMEFRECLLNSHPIFQKSAECAVLMARIINWLGAADKDKHLCPFNQHMRRPGEIFIFGEHNNQTRLSVLRFDSQLQNEERVADMNYREFASVSVVGESVFVIGGSTGQQEGITCADEFLVTERRWRKRAPLAGRRRDHAAAVVKVDAAADKEGGEKALIAVFGGCFKDGDTFTHIASCEVFDVIQNKWHKLPDLREELSGLTAASLPGDNRLFVIGGRNDSYIYAFVKFCYLRADWEEKVASASTAEFWLPAAPMRNPRACHAAVPFRGKILVVGGCNGSNTLNTVELFSPPNASCPLGQWTELAAMTQPRRYFTLISSGHAVFALDHREEPLNTVEIFTAPECSVDFGNDLTSWIWSPKSPVESLNLIVGAATIRI